MAAFFQMLPTTFIYYVQFKVTTEFIFTAEL